MVCLTVFGIVTLVVLGKVPVEMMKDVITALAPVWTAIVSAIAGAITGRRTAA
ncbi:MAG: hypothetical protein J7J01_02605 [Methanophagales archaeon]|nr:hypothetical protein [Methanophagales archaeon]